MYNLPFLLVLAGRYVLICARSRIQLDRLWTTDTRALNHILTHSADFQKPSEARRNLARIVGEGLYSHQWSERMSFR